MGRRDDVGAGVVARGARVLGVGVAHSALVAHNVVIVVAGRRRPGFRTVTPKAAVGASPLLLLDDADGERQCRGRGRVAAEGRRRGWACQARVVRIGAKGSGQAVCRRRGRGRSAAGDVRGHGGMSQGRGVAVARGDDERGRGRRSAGQGDGLVLRRSAGVDAVGVG